MEVDLEIYIMFLKLVSLVGWTVFLCTSQELEKPEKIKSKMMFLFSVFSEVLLCRTEYCIIQNC